MTRLFLAFALLAAPALADPAEMVGAEMQKSGDGWTFSVTLRHADTGWDDYADGWRVELADGTILGTRELAHPHVNEQPFTRSQSGIEIPEATETVHIRASTSPEGWADDTYEVALPD